MVAQTVSVAFARELAERHRTAGVDYVCTQRDLRLAPVAAGEAGRTLPMLDAAYGQMAVALDQGLSDRDCSVMAEVTTRGGSDTR